MHARAATKTSTFVNSYDDISEVGEGLGKQDNSDESESKNGASVRSNTVANQLSWSHKIGGILPLQSLQLGWYVYRQVWMRHGVPNSGPLCRIECQQLSDQVQKMPVNNVSAKNNVL